MNMLNIEFEFASGGMSECFYSDKIQIFKPSCRVIHFLEDYASVHPELVTVNDLVLFLANSTLQSDDNYGRETSYEDVYIKGDDYLLGFQEDKNLSDLHEYFETSTLSFITFTVFGGSVEAHGFTFRIFPSESTHEHSPHVHVEKNGKSVRYSLIDFRRYPNDKVTKEYLKAEKKKIIPFIRRNKEMLRDLWNHYQNGFSLPYIDEDGKQYYKES